MKNDEDADVWFDVEKVLSAKQVRGRTKYRIRWKGCEKTDWIDEDDLSEEAKRQYHINYTKQGKKRKHVLRRSL